MPRLSNERHELFCLKFLKHRNATRAGREVGGQERTGEFLIARPDIQKRIRELTERMLTNADITAQRVMLELARVAFADVREAFDEQGALLPVHEMGNDAAAVIVGIEHETRFERTTEIDLATGEPVKRRIEVRTAKIKRANKDAALGLLAKHFKIVGDEGDGVNALASALADRLKTARKRSDTPPEEPLA